MGARADLREAKRLLREAASRPARAAAGLRELGRASAELPLVERDVLRLEVIEQIKKIGGELSHGATSAAATEGTRERFVRFVLAVVVNLGDLLTGDPTVAHFIALATRRPAATTAKESRRPSKELEQLRGALDALTAAAEKDEEDAIRAAGAAFFAARVAVGPAARALVRERLDAAAEDAGEDGPAALARLADRFGRAVDGTTVLSAHPLVVAARQPRAETTILADDLHERFLGEEESEAESFGGRIADRLAARSRFLDGPGLRGFDEKFFEFDDRFRFLEGLFNKEPMEWALDLPGFEFVRPENGGATLPGGGGFSFGSGGSLGSFGQAGGLGSFAGMSAGAPLDLPASVLEALSKGALGGSVRGLPSNVAAALARLAPRDLATIARAGGIDLRALLGGRGLSLPPSFSPSIGSGGLARVLASFGDLGGLRALAQRTSSRGTGALGHLFAGYAGGSGGGFGGLSGLGGFGHTGGMSLPAPLRAMFGSPGALDSVAFASTVAPRLALLFPGLARATSERPAPASAPLALGSLRHAFTSESLAALTRLPGFSSALFGGPRFGSVGSFDSGFGGGSGSSRPAIPPELARLLGPGFARFASGGRLDLPAAFSGAGGLGALRGLSASALGSLRGISPSAFGPGPRFSFPAMSSGSSPSFPSGSFPSGSFPSGSGSYPRPSFGSLPTLGPIHGMFMDGFGRPRLESLGSVAGLLSGMSPFRFDLSRPGSMRPFTGSSLSFGQGFSTSTPSQPGSFTFPTGPRFGTQVPSSLGPLSLGRGTSWGLDSFGRFRPLPLGRFDGNVPALPGFPRMGSFAPAPRFDASGLPRFDGASGRLPAGFDFRGLGPLERFRSPEGLRLDMFRAALPSLGGLDMRTFTATSFGPSSIARGTPRSIPAMPGARWPGAVSWPSSFGSSGTSMMMPGPAGLGMMPGFSGLGMMAGLSGLRMMPGLSGLGMMPGVSGPGGLPAFAPGMMPWPSLGPSFRAPAWSMSAPSATSRPFVQGGASSTRGWPTLPPLSFASMPSSFPGLASFPGFAPGSFPTGRFQTPAIPSRLVSGARGMTALPGSRTVAPSFGFSPLAIPSLAPPHVAGALAMSPGMPFFGPGLSFPPFAFGGRPGLGLPSSFVRPDVRSFGPLAALGLAPQLPPLRFAGAFEGPRLPTTLGSLGDTLRARTPELSFALPAFPATAASVTLPSVPSQLPARGRAPSAPAAPALSPTAPRLPAGPSPSFPAPTLAQEAWLSGLLGFPAPRALLEGGNLRAFAWPRTRGASAASAPRLREMVLGGASFATPTLPGARMGVTPLPAPQDASGLRALLAFDGANPWTKTAGLEGVPAPRALPRLERAPRSVETRGLVSLGLPGLDGLGGASRLTARLAAMGDIGDLRVPGPKPVEITGFHGGVGVETAPIALPGSTTPSLAPGRFPELSAPGQSRFPGRDGPRPVAGVTRPGIFDITVPAGPRTAPLPTAPRGGRLGRTFDLTPVSATPAPVATPELSPGFDFTPALMGLTRTPGASPAARPAPSPATSPGPTRPPLGVVPSIGRVEPEGEIEDAPAPTARAGRSMPRSFELAATEIATPSFVGRSGAARPGPGRVLRNPTPIAATAEKPGVARIGEKPDLAPRWQVLARDQLAGRESHLPIALDTTLPATRPTSFGFDVAQVGAKRGESRAPRTTTTAPFEPRGLRAMVSPEALESADTAELARSSPLAGSRPGAAVSRGAASRSVGTAPAGALPAVFGAPVAPGATAEIPGAKAGPIAPLDRAVLPARPTAAPATPARPRAAPATPARPTAIPGTPAVSATAPLAELPATSPTANRIATPIARSTPAAPGGRAAPERLELVSTRPSQAVELPRPVARADRPAPAVPPIGLPARPVAQAKDSAPRALPTDVAEPGLVGSARRREAFLPEARYQARDGFGAPKEDVVKALFTTTGGPERPAPAPVPAPRSAPATTAGRPVATPTPSDEPAAESPEMEHAQLVPMRSSIQEHVPTLPEETGNTHAPLEAASQGGSPQDLSPLIYQLYARIKRELIVEKERRSGS